MSLFTDSLISSVITTLFTQQQAVTLTSERMKPFSPPSLFWSLPFPDFLFFLAPVERPRLLPRGAARAVRDRDLDFGLALRLRLRDVDVGRLPGLAALLRRAAVPRFDVWLISEDWVTVVAAAFDDGSVPAPAAGFVGTAAV